MSVREQLDTLNRNGWSWVLVSNATEGVIRIRLVVKDDGMAGKSIEGLSFEDALEKARAFVEGTDADEFTGNYYDMLYDAQVLSDEVDEHNDLSR